MTCTLFPNTRVIPVQNFPFAFVYILTEGRSWARKVIWKWTDVLTFVFPQGHYFCQPADSRCCGNRGNQIPAVFVYHQQLCQQWQAHQGGWPGSIFFFIPETLPHIYYVVDRQNTAETHVSFFHPCFSTPHSPRMWRTWPKGYALFWWPLPRWRSTRMTQRCWWTCSTVWPSPMPALLSSGRRGWTAWPGSTSKMGISRR